MSHDFHLHFFNLKTRNFFSCAKFSQAKGAAQTGGTMLLYGAANAHFNALLELTERLTDGMRTRLSKIVEIGEVRFEQVSNSSSGSSSGSSSNSNSNNTNPRR